MHVSAGQTVAVLRDLQLESESAETEAGLSRAAARNVQAKLRYADFAGFEQQQERMAEAQKIIRERQQELSITSPIAGTVISPRARDLVGSYVAMGTLIAEIADTSTLNAEIYVQESEFQKVQQIDKAVLHLDSVWRPVPAEFSSWSPVSRELAPGLIPAAKFKGMHPPVY